jgi:hypothetical protein
VTVRKPRGKLRAEEKRPLLRSHGHVMRRVQNGSIIQPRLLHPASRWHPRILLTGVVHALCLPFHESMLSRPVAGWRARAVTARAGTAVGLKLDARRCFASTPRAQRWAQGVVAGTVGTRAAGQTPIDHLLARIEPQDATATAEATDGRPLLTLLLTPAYAQHALAGDLPVRVLQHLSSAPPTQPFDAITAVVDKLPSPTGPATGVEGLGFMFFPTAPLFPDWPRAPLDPMAQRPGSISLELQCFRDKQSYSETIELPLAQTIFSTGLVSTLVHAKFAMGSNGTLKKEGGQQLERQLIHLPFRPKMVQHRLHAPLLPLTPGRLVVNSMGNIVRTLSANVLDDKTAECTTSAVQPASSELEDAVTQYFKVRGIPPEPVQVWALVVPEAHRPYPLPRGYKVRKGRALNLLGLSPGGISELWSDSTKDRQTLARRALGSAVLRGRAKLCKVLSGGGGWGKKAGLLSLDPDATYHVRGIRDNHAWDFDLDLADENDEKTAEGHRREALGDVVAEGDGIWFFIAPNDPGLVEDQLTLLQSLPPNVPTAHFGSIPSTIDSGPSHSQGSASIIYENGLFGALSEGGMALTIANGQRDRMQTKLDVPFSYLRAFEPLDSSETSKSSKEQQLSSEPSTCKQSESVEAPKRSKRVQRAKAAKHSEADETSVQPEPSQTLLLSSEPEPSKQLDPSKEPKSWNQQTSSEPSGQESGEGLVSSNDPFQAAGEALDIVSPDKQRFSGGQTMQKFFRMSTSTLKTSNDAKRLARRERGAKAGLAMKKRGLAFRKYVDYNAPLVREPIRRRKRLVEDFGGFQKIYFMFRKTATTSFAAFRPKTDVPLFRKLEFRRGPVEPSRRKPRILRVPTRDCWNESENRPEPPSITPDESVQDDHETNERPRPTLQKPPAKSRGDSRDPLGVYLNQGGQLEISVGKHAAELSFRKHVSRNHVFRKHISGKHFSHGYVKPIKAGGFLDTSLEDSREYQERKDGFESVLERHIASSSIPRTERTSMNVYDNPAKHRAGTGTSATTKRGISEVQLAPLGTEDVQPTPPGSEEIQSPRSDLGEVRFAPLVTNEDQFSQLGTQVVQSTEAQSPSLGSQSLSVQEAERVIFDTDPGGHQFLVPFAIPLDVASTIDAKYQALLQTVQGVLQEKPELANCIMGVLEHHLRQRQSAFATADCQVMSHKRRVEFWRAQTSQAWQGIAKSLL